MESDRQGHPTEPSSLDEYARASRKRFFRRLVGGIVGGASLLFVTGLVMQAVRADAAEPPAKPIAALPAAPPPAAPAAVAPAPVTQAVVAKPASQAAQPAPKKTTTTTTTRRGSVLR